MVVTQFSLTDKKARGWCVKFTYTKSRFLTEIIDTVTYVTLIIANFLDPIFFSV